MDMSEASGDVLRRPPVHLADEAQRQVELIIALPARMRHAAYYRDQAIADRTRRLEGDEQAMHGGFVPLSARAQNPRKRFRLKASPDSPI